MKPLQILIAGQIYTGGNGQGVFTIRLAENLTKQGHQVRMLVPSDRRRSYSVSINGVQVEKVAATHMPIIHPGLYYPLWPAPRVRRIFQDFPPDIVHIQDHYLLCKAVVQEAHNHHVPLIGTNHFLPENLFPYLAFLIKFRPLRNLAGRLLWKMMLDVFNQLVAATTPSQAAAEILHDQDIRCPVQVISNGVDTGHFFPDPKVDRLTIRRKYGLAHDRPLFLYVGRLDGEKRLDILLQAVFELPHANLQLAIAGDGLQAQALRQRVRQLGLEGRVVFPGFVPAVDLPALYTSADIFVMPSPEELQSIATLEAIACGKPILAANARALPALVVHGVNGYLFEPGNASDAAHWMSIFLATPEQWARMGQASLTRSQSHSLNNTTQAYEECYRMVIEEKDRLENHPKA